MSFYMMMLLERYENSIKEGNSHVSSNDFYKIKDILQNIYYERDIDLDRKLEEYTYPGKKYRKVPITEKDKILEKMSELDYKIMIEPMYKGVEAIIIDSMVLIEDKGEVYNISKLVADKLSLYEVMASKADVRIVIHPEDDDVEKLKDALINNDDSYNFDKTYVILYDLIDFNIPFPDQKMITGSIINDTVRVPVHKIAVDEESCRVFLENIEDYIDSFTESLDGLLIRYADITPRTKYKSTKKYYKDSFIIKK